MEKIEISNTTKPRFKVLDIMKGFGMIALVTRHSYSPIGHYFEIFLLAMFLMVSGFTWNETRTQTWKDTWELIKKRFKALMVPFFVYTIVFWSLTNVFIWLNLYPVHMPEVASFLLPDGYLGIGGYFMGLIFIALNLIGSVFTAALWYVHQLFFIYVLHAVVCRIFCKFIRTERSRLVFYLILTAVVILVTQFIHSLDDEKFKLVKLLVIRFLTCYAGFIMGVPARILYNKLNISGISPIQIALFVITAGLLYFMQTFTTIDLGAGNITSVWQYIVCAVLGFIFTFCLSNILENIKSTRKIANALSYIGQHTMSIMAYHLLCFKPAALIYILVCGLSLTELKQFPIIIDANYYWMWIFYSISGIVFSLLLDKFFKMCKSIIRK